MIVPQEPEETVLGVPAYDMPNETQNHVVPGIEPDDNDAIDETEESPVLFGDLWPRNPDAYLGPQGFDADQIKQLYRQLNHHCQLLIEVFALTACNATHQETAKQLGSLLCEYQVS